jgi:hypothetical protein
VRIPALNLTFIGYTDDGKLMLDSVGEVNAYGIRPGSTLPATEIFERLRAFAQRHDELPR